MKPDGGGATGAMPELVGGEVLDDGLDVLADLLQGVRGGLEIGLDAGHRTAQPDFGNGVHDGKIWATIGAVTKGQETMRLSIEHSVSNLVSLAGSLLWLLSAGCQASPGSSASNSPQPSQADTGWVDAAPPSEEKVQGTALPPSSLVGAVPGPESFAGRGKRRVIRDATTWRNTWLDLHRSDSSVSLPLVDFRTDMVLAASGFAPGDGGLCLDTVAQSGDTMIAVVVYDLGSGMTGIIARTTFVRVPRSHKPVRFVERVRRSQCGASD
jgi:hypothetical protein